MDEYWVVNFDSYDPENEPLREALCALGNGYFATRGAFEENEDDDLHYPGTYLACGYNRMKSEISGQVIENEDLVNWPNWLKLTFKPAGGDWLNLDEMKLHEYSQQLNLKEGYLQREMLVEDGEGRKTHICSRRLVHMDQMHLAAIQWELTPKDWSGEIVVHSAIDGSVINNGVERYSQLNSRHLKTLETGSFEEEGIFLKTQTRQSEIVMAQAARTRVIFKDKMGSVQRETVQKEDYIGHELKFAVQRNQTVGIEKVVSVFTSRDTVISEPVIEAQKTVMRAGSFAELLESHRVEWEKFWSRTDTVISCSQQEEQMVLRLHLFHLIQTVSQNSIGLDVGVPSRGWHGEAYRGHIFWDELFVLPFLTQTYPELARSLLMYRYKRIDEARHNARQSGYRGAMFPWQSGSDGREESQKIHLNPKSGNWIPDETHIQRHVNSAIAFNIWHYYQATNDREFMNYCGAKMFLDIALFWASKSTWNEERQKYEICKVVGPDEYHTSYPDADEPGLSNNAYTNVFAVWVLKRALQIVELLDDRRRGEVLGFLGVDHDDLELWDKISRNMFVPFIEENKIISQFEGYEDLEELDWKHYHKEHGEVLRLDRILEKENDTPNRYKASKQADVLMLFYLFSGDELESLFQRLGYDFKKKYITENVRYYEARTSHGSTLSKVVHSWVMARSNRDKSWHNFKKALMSDFKDIQGGTTSEGIHLGAMAGTVDLIQRCYTGLVFRDDKLWLNPHLPKELTKIDFSIRYRGSWIRILLEDGTLLLQSEAGWSEEPVEVVVKNESHKLKKGEEIRFRLLKTRADVIS